MMVLYVKKCYVSVHRPFMLSNIKENVKCNIILPIKRASYNHV